MRVIRIVQLLSTSKPASFITFHRGILSTQHLVGFTMKRKSVQSKTTPEDSASSGSDCRLVSVQNLHEPVNLPDGHPVIVGRQKQFKIKDKNCSKEHVKITADHARSLAVVEQLGSNPSVINSTLIKEKSPIEWKEGEILHLVLDKVSYKLEFSCGNVDKKRKIDKDTVTAGASDTAENDEADDDVTEKLKKMKESFAAVPEKKKKEVAAVSDKASVGNDGGVVTSGWSEHDSLMIYKSEGLKNSEKLASFDMDSTIITTKSGRVFPTGPSDWQILYAEIPRKLKQLNADGFKVVFFTNQLGVSKGKISKPDFKKKIEAIVKLLGCPIHVQAATKTDYYRKPCIGTFEYYTKTQNGGIPLDMTESFFCGDAAGRPENKEKKRKKDFSCADRFFALNIGLKFYTPEEFFLGQKPERYNMPEFNPKSLFEKVDSLNTDNLVSKSKEMIVNCGFPASGKSHFSRTVLVPKGYVYVSRDELGTWQKCVSRCKEALESGKSVVVDNTNPDVESRGRYIAEAQAAGVPCRCFYYPASLSHCRHNETFRQMTDSSHARINDMVMNSFKKKFKMPDILEGFSDIVTVPFCPKFKNKKEEDLYKLHLLDK